MVVRCCLDKTEQKPEHQTRSTLAGVRLLHTDLDHVADQLVRGKVTQSLHGSGIVRTKWDAAPLVVRDVFDFD